LAALFVLNWWKVRHALSKIVAILEPLPDGFAGEPRTIHCLVTNQGRNIARGTQVVVTFAEQTSSWYIARLKAQGTVTLSRAVSLQKRGVFSIGEVRLKNSFPFGLIESSTQLKSSRSIACYPRRGKIDLAKLIRFLTSKTVSHGSHRTAVRQLTDGTDIHGLRPFRAGDSPRWIHWRTTARIGERMVREFDRATGPHLSVVVVPFGKSSLSMEPALELAATIIWEWSRRQDGRLNLWLPISGRWECMTLDQRRRVDNLLRRLSAISVADLRCAEPIPNPTGQKNRVRFVYIKQGRLDTDRWPRISTAMCIDPTIASDVYSPPISEHDERTSHC